MPKVATIQTNFTGGELSPLIYSGRVDTAKYPNGVARMENFHVTTQGGAESRPGSAYVGVAKGISRLIPFVFDRTTAYQIELGSLQGASYLRIWRADRTQVMAGIAPLEIACPFDIVTLFALTYEQAEDTMFFFHEALPTQRLQRLSDTNWALVPLPYVTAPFAEQGYTPPNATAVTLSGVGVGSQTATAASSAFLAGDVGRGFVSGQGSGTITAVTSATSATVNVVSPFASTALANFSLTDSPFAFLTARQKEPVGSTVVVDAALSRAAGITLSAKTGSITITADAAVFTAGDTGRQIYGDAGVATLTYTDATHCAAAVTTDFLRNSYQTGAWGITGDAFRNFEVGSYIRLNSGLLLVTGWASAAQLQAKILVSPSAVVAAPPGAWDISQGNFSPVNGYPRCGALHEQRLYEAGTVVEPQTVWASRISEYLDFEPGLLDADGFTYALSMRQRNPILHLVSGKRLFAFTSGIEASMRGGNEKAMGPTNIQKDNESGYGSARVRPVTVGKEVIFLQGGARKVRALGYSAAIDGYDSPDRTVFAEHITSPGVTEMAYQPSRSLLYCVRSDGVMAVCGYDVAQEVIGWSRYITQGLYQSVSVVPTATRDDVWTVVNRPDASGNRYFIEVFDSTLATDCAGYVNTRDAGPPGSKTITGLGRFEGVAVAVRADDANMGPLTVLSGGSITLPRYAVSYIEAGLAFVPLLELLPPDLGSGSTIQGSNVSVHEVSVRLLDTRDLEINGTLSDFRQFGSTLLDQPPPGLTGDYRVIKLTDDLYRDKLVIRQPLPFKTRVQAVIRKLTVNDT